MKDLDDYLLEYLDKFGEGFPMIPVAWGREESEVIGLIKKCITAGKTAYDMGLVDEETDDLY